MFHPMPPFPQGECGFVALLKAHTPFVPHWDTDRGPAPSQFDARAGIRPVSDFPDPERLLETAFCDFTRFLREAGLAGERHTVAVRPVPGMAHESYRLTVSPAEIVLEAGDTEGVRRGLYFLADQLAASPFLSLGSITRKPWLKNRISRCFFGPIKRPPFNIDELANDIDYYPEEYLSRLASEGINGLWLTVTFRELCGTSFRPAPADAARHLEKLRRTVERCRRYGIKTWVFCIEPIFWSQGNRNPVPTGCESFCGPGENDSFGNDFFSFCVNSKEARRYLYECTFSLFSQVPHLWGMITISLGERTTSCLSLAEHSAEGVIPCPRRCAMSPSEILGAVLGSMNRGMRDANPDAELVSWFYIPFAEQRPGWIADLPSGIPGDVTLAFNFESGITARQLGKVRAGGDYWLSEVGPSDRFRMMAEAARGHCRFAAKLQVACSHECATVPYIPAPGLVYRKYREMHALGVSSVIQCWFFGNYPGVMNEAAGKLAFEDFSRSEDEFLLELATPAWGRHAATVVAVWRKFAEGYANYPLDIQFQYYGPMHDGPVWPLHLRPEMTPLTRSWTPDDFPAGDAVGECMAHFELSELVTLTGELSRVWHAGFEILQRVERDGNELEFSLAEALDIQFASGNRILRFYLLRNALLNNPQDAARLLDGMEKLVESEIAASRRLAELCRQDARLGYHSEAEVYKYFPEKLEWRARELEELLRTDFPPVRAALARGEKPGDVLASPLAVAVPGKTYGGDFIHWTLDADAEMLTFHIDVTRRTDAPEHLFLLFSDPLAEQAIPAQIKFVKTPAMLTPSGWHVDAVVPRSLVGGASRFGFGIQYTAPEQYSNDLPEPSRCLARLNLGFFSPDKLREIQL